MILHSIDFICRFESIRVNLYFSLSFVWMWKTRLLHSLYIYKVDSAMQGNLFWDVTHRILDSLLALKLSKWNPNPEIYWICNGNIAATSYIMISSCALHLFIKADHQQTCSSAGRTSKYFTGADRNRLEILLCCLKCSLLQILTYCNQHVLWLFIWQSFVEERNQNQNKTNRHSFVMFWQS